MVACACLCSIVVLDLGVAVDEHAQEETEEEGLAEEDQDDEDDGRGHGLHRAASGAHRGVHDGVPDRCGMRPRPRDRFDLENKKHVINTSSGVSFFLISGSGSLGECSVPILAGHDLEDRHEAPGEGVEVGPRDALLRGDPRRLRVRVRAYASELENARQTRTTSPEVAVRKYRESRIALE